MQKFILYLSTPYNIQYTNCLNYTHQHFFVKHLSEESEN